MAATEPTNTPPKNEMRLQIPVFFIILLVLIQTLHLQITSHNIIFVVVICNKNITVAFTGHRHYGGDANERIYDRLEELYSQGYRCFLSGMAWGFDLAAAEQVIRLQELHPDITLVIVEPYADFRKLFRGEDARRYDAIANSATQRVVVGDDKGRESYFQRNKYLVEHSSLLVAWWNGQKRSGTAYTVKYALREGVSVENLYCGEMNLFSGL